jgi:hypothetical protein
LKPLIHIKDPEKAAGFYDNCINNSPNGLIYAQSWYLNIVSPEWEILAAEDHSAVMPLPLIKSLGRKIIRQPDFAWQLGIFSTQVPSPEIIRHFIQSIPKSYRLRRLCLSKLNIVESSSARFLNSAELDLIRPYRHIQSNYGPSMQKQLSLAADHSISYVGNISVHDMLMFAYKLDKFHKQGLKPREISILRLIITNSIRFRAGQIGAAYDKHNNLCATVVFLINKGRASILHAAASNEGLAAGAIEYIIDRFIETNAEKNLVLCVDNPAERKLMDILKCCGSGISNFPCLKSKQY